MHFRNITLLIFTVFSCNTLLAQSDFKPMKDQVAFRNKIEKITNETQTIQCDFVQEKSLSFLNEKMVSKGKFYFKQTDKIRWEYDSPFSYIIVLNGGKLLIDDEGKKNEMDLSNNQTFKEINGLLSKTLQGDIFQKDDRFSKEVFENNAFVMVKLQPLTEAFKAYITEIKVFFDKKDMMVAKVEMVEGEDLTKIMFENRKINTNLPQNLFQVSSK
ncbi:MAG: outer membrane lipoprotein carrier protein LolA [Saprospiraceae bacterium]